jgi:hypothetical protein
MRLNCARAKRPKEKGIPLKALSEDPVDEFIMHLITIEAALGLETDPQSKKTACVVSRISNLRLMPLRPVAQLVVAARAAA